MKWTQSLKAIGTLVALVLAGLLSNPLEGQAQDHRNNNEATCVERGSEIAPVPLYLFEKDLELVGLGSYLVNAVAGCNGCHTGGLPPNFDYASGGSPYFGQNQKVDQTVFKQILRTGVDFDHRHPTCTSAQLTQLETGAVRAPVCIPTASGAAVKGNLRQEMPWPAFSYMSDGDLDAIYEYLSAIPCIEGPIDPSAPLHNDSGTQP